MTCPGHGGRRVPKKKQLKPWKIGVIECHRDTDEGLLQTEPQNVCLGSVLALRFETQRKTNLKDKIILCDVAASFDTSPVKCRLPSHLGPCRCGTFVPSWVLFGLWNTLFWIKALYKQFQKHTWSTTKFTKSAHSWELLLSPTSTTECRDTWWWLTNGLLLIGLLAHWTCLGPPIVWTPCLMRGSDKQSVKAEPVELRHSHCAHAQPSGSALGFFSRGCGPLPPIDTRGQVKIAHDDSGLCTYHIYIHTRWEWKKT